MKEIQVLEELIAGLQAKDFDLEAWKQKAAALLSRIFGENSPKIKQIQGIGSDYSSWSLRDTSGRLSNLESSKKFAREALVAAIEEIRAFGLPDEAEKQSVPAEIILNALENELKVTQIREIIAIVDSAKSSEEKNREILKKLNTLKPAEVSAILAAILSNSALPGKLKL